MNAYQFYILHIHTHMKKILSTIGIVITTIAAFALILKVLPTEPTTAEMERDMQTALDQSDEYHEKARIHSCDLYATLYANCIKRKVGACENRDKVAMEHSAEFGGEPEDDCEPDAFIPNEPIPLEVDNSGDPLFFGDEESQ